MSTNHEHGWGFLTNHGHVLVALHQNPDLRQRDLARLVGITEGAIQRILTELQSEGYVEIERIGRRNSYRTNTTLGMRHPIEADHRVGELLECLSSPNETAGECSDETQASGGPKAA